MLLQGMGASVHAAHTLILTPTCFLKGKEEGKEEPLSESVSYEDESCSGEAEEEEKGGEEVHAAAAESSKKRKQPEGPSSASSSPKKVGAVLLVVCACWVHVLRCPTTGFDAAFKEA